VSFCDYGYEALGSITRNFLLKRTAFLSVTGRKFCTVESYSKPVKLRVLFLGSPELNSGPNFVCGYHLLNPVVNED
jgi:hypothetical protein